MDHVLFSSKAAILVACPESRQDLEMLVEMRIVQKWMNRQLMQVDKV